MEKHVKFIGILWIVYGALSFLAGFLVFGILFGISFIPDMGHEAPVILRGVGLGIGLLLTILALPKVIAGVGILKRQEWGRILTIVLSFLCVLSFPLGTALAIYSFVILIKEESSKLFK
jgi:hypothetical protein